MTCISGYYLCPVHAPSTSASFPPSLPLLPYLSLSFSPPLFPSVPPLPSVPRSLTLFPPLPPFVSLSSTFPYFPAFHPLFSPSLSLSFSISISLHSSPSFRPSVSLSLPPCLPSLILSLLPHTFLPSLPPFLPCSRQCCIRPLAWGRLPLCFSLLILLPRGASSCLTWVVCLGRRLCFGVRIRVGAVVLFEAGLCY